MYCYISGHTQKGVPFVLSLDICIPTRPWAGHIIQKHGPIKVLRVILILNGFALILYTITGLGGYLVARMLQGVSTAFFSMALQIGIIE